MRLPEGLRAPLGLALTTLTSATLAGALPARAGLTLPELCERKGPVLFASADTDLFTGPEVLNHLPGPTPENFGDRRIGTEDDGIHPGLTFPPQPGFEPVFGCPNDLAGMSAVPGITCGVPGSPGTQLLVGTDPRTSQESNLHSPDENRLNLSREGHGAYSFVIATVGQFQSLSYLAGSTTGLVAGFDGFNVEVQVVNVTLGGTTLVPNVFFRGPFNADLITVGPGDDLKYDGIHDDETVETIARGCNGLAPGVDGVDDWFPVGPGPFPVFPDVRTANRGRWDARSSPEKGGRLLTARSDTLTKVVTSAGFFVVPDVTFAGYLLPLDEAEALTTSLFRPDARNLDDLPDLPGFPGSGKNLARYFVDVLVPKAFEDPDNRLVTFLRGTTVVEIIGIETLLDVTAAGGGNFGEFDICDLNVTPCAF